ncbi:nitrous oxide reductase accessory protein NosL [Salinimicrobium terrae]|uniref:nitrous oxide reductase accessory protein NosL n=1 Tax=Salinimicrobium terrae TaxID=470866 RepID=UPI0009FDBFA4|nr:nitrous oxide reductase accessory protein NosL [Salinimicrobium terrae]
MKKIKSLLYTLSLLGVLASCSTKPEAIRYGEDSCHFCEMTIVSKAHAAQAVSTKGKQFKYDAIECMVHDLQRNEAEMAIKQVANYSQPGTMLQVNEAQFIINDSINSPMGENLAAIKATAKNAPTYTWNELKAQFQSEKSVTSNEVQ